MNMRLMILFLAVVLLVTACSNTESFSKVDYSNDCVDISVLNEKYHDGVFSFKLAMENACPYEAFVYVLTVEDANGDEYSLRHSASSFASVIGCYPAKLSVDETSREEYTFSSDIKPKGLEIKKVVVAKNSSLDDDGCDFY